jgi:hypothetical protein
MSSPASVSYDPRAFKALIFHDCTPRFRDGSDTPRAYLERCLETITAREPEVQAFVVLNEAGAREAADSSTAARCACRASRCVGWLNAQTRAGRANRGHGCAPSHPVTT